MIFTVFGLSVELGQAEQGDLQFTGETFESSCDFGDLFLSRVF